MKRHLNTNKLLYADWSLRFGLAISFFWIGLMILSDPLVWGSYINPWAEALLPLPLEQMMITTGYYDIITGALFLIPPVAFLAGLLGVSHMIVVLTTSGINEGTVRDIAILGASLSVIFLYWPFGKKKNN